VQIPYGCNNTVSAQELKGASVQRNNNTSIYNDLRRCPNRSLFRSGFSAYFSRFFEARFSTTISTEASIQIPLFLTVLGEKTIKQARGNPQNPHVLSTFTASRVSHRQTEL
jgi:hypothetical protein